MDILIVTRVPLFRFLTRCRIFRGCYCRLMILRQNFHLFFDGDVIRSLPRVVHFWNFYLYQSVFQSASFATLSLIPLTLAMTILNIFKKSWRDSSSFWARLQRLTQEDSLSMNIEYCLRNSEASWRKLPMEFHQRRENYSSAAPWRFSTKRRQWPESLSFFFSMAFPMAIWKVCGCDLGSVVPS